MSDESFRAGLISVFEKFFAKPAIKGMDCSHYFISHYFISHYFISHCPHVMFVLGGMLVRVRVRVRVAVRVTVSVHERSCVARAYRSVSEWFTLFWFALFNLATDHTCLYWVAC